MGQREREREKEGGRQIESINPWTRRKKQRKQFCVRESGEAEEVR